jgi:hypothetical protein
VIAASLRPVAKAIDVVDLWPDRHDGYDLTDRILERRRNRSRPSRPRPVRSLLLPDPSHRAGTRMRAGTRSTSGGLR